MDVFKINQHRLKPSFIIFLIIIITFTIVGIFKSKILDLFYLPLEISSSFIADTKAIITYKFILNENLRLKKEIYELKRNFLNQEELRQENGRLKKLLSFKEQSQFSSVAAKVIGMDVQNWTRAIIINKGSRQNIKVGNVVITELGLVGKVVEVSNATSKVMLINDPDSSVACVIQRSREEGLASGTLLGGVIIRYLEIDSDVEIGDDVLTSGLTDNYPASIPIGKVEKIIEEQQGLGKYCVLKPAVDLRRVEEVLAIIK